MDEQQRQDYHTLGIAAGANFGEVKRAYRRLVRKYHPDINPDNPFAAHQFIHITAAYERLLAALPRQGDHPPTPSSAPNPVVPNPHLSPAEQHLKASTYTQLQSFLQQQRYPRAIALVDGLAQRLPQDGEVRQWQAITYQRWGRALVGQGHYAKARLALKKALRIDPRNKALWQEVNRDFQRMEHQVWQETAPRR